MQTYLYHCKVCGHLFKEDEAFTLVNPFNSFLKIFPKLEPKGKDKDIRCCDKPKLYMIDNTIPDIINEELKKGKEILPIFDGDGIPHIVSYKMREKERYFQTEQECKQLITEYIDGVLEIFEAKQYIGIIAGTVDCFRKKVAVTKKYKGKREPAEYYTVWSPFIKEYLVKLGFKRVNCDIESDDALAIENKKYRDSNYLPIMVHNDKDMYQIEGHHFNYKSRKFRYVDNNLGIIERNGSKVYATAYKLLMMQCLAGDSVDNYSGLPKRGPVAAFNILDKCRSRYECLLKVGREYKSVYKEDWRAKFLETYNLAKILDEREGYEYADFIPLEVCEKQQVVVNKSISMMDLFKSKHNINK